MNRWILLICAGFAWSWVAQAGAESLSEGLLLHYSFDADGSDIVSDDSGNGRTARVNGATWVADGIRGGAMRFEAGGEHLEADDAGLPAGDASRTMALWVRLHARKAEPLTGLLYYGLQQRNRMSGIGVDWRVGRANLYFTQCGGVALSDWRMEAAGRWHHLAYVYEGYGRHHFYVDGESTDGMSELWGPLQTVLSGRLVVGGPPEELSSFARDLDDIRIYGRALDALEIAELAQLPDPGAVVEAAAGLDEPEVPDWTASAAPLTFVLHRLSMDPAASGGAVLEWASVPGDAYDVYWTDDLTKGFSCLASNLVAADTAMAITNRMEGASKVFYAVKWRGAR